jgi:membrane-bound lytic murein transglycosylase B
VTHRRTLLLLALSAPLLPAFAAAPKHRTHARFDLDRSDIRDFAAQAATRTGLGADEVLALLAQAEPQSSILDAMSRPAESVLPWWQYRERFLQTKRIADGLAFWDRHATLLQSVEQDRGIPAEYLVAILGVETNYGRVIGRYRVLDALATLGFDYPSRAAYFRSELEEFLLLAKEDKLDPLAIKGSYAGAMGAPQFMPSSIRRFAVDAEGKGHRDLWHDWHDVLASIANYLSMQGWRQGEPVLAEARRDGEADDPLAFRLLLADTLGAIRGRGYEVEASQPDSAQALLVPAEQADSMGWRVGFNNFYVITRYNRSPRYAMAVHDLASALRAGRNETEALA